MNISSTLFINGILAVLLAISKNTFTKEHYANQNLVSIKEWLKMVSDPNTKCIESESESSQGMSVKLHRYKYIVLLK